MAKDSDKTKDEGTTTSTTTTAQKPGDDQQPQAIQQPRQIDVDDTKLIKAYANFCRVTPGFEELIIDFGLSPQPIGAPQPPVTLDQRIIVNYYTAKRLLAALSAAVQRHEQIFGVLETDVQKRVQPSARVQR